MDNSPRNVLLVEDDIVDVMAVKRLFKRFDMSHKYQLHTAENGAEAIAMLRGESGYNQIMPSPRVIFLDLNMPKMNGFEFLELLRADPDFKQTKVIVLTTSDAPEDRRKATTANVAGYIVKPITLSQFVEAITTLSRFQ